MKIIICGAHAIGTHLAMLLARDNENITLIDESEERLSQVGSNYDLLTMQAPPNSIKALKEAGVAHADLFIAVTPNESLNMSACMMAKALGTKKTVAKIDKSEYMEPEAQAFFAKMGIDSLIYPELLAARDIIAGLKMSWVRQRWDVHDGALVMLGIKIRETCEIMNRPLKELCGPDDPYHIVAIKRGQETIIPGGNDELQLYDLAYFMTTKQYIPYIRKIVGKEQYADVKNVMIMGGGKTAVRTVKQKPEYMSVKIIEPDTARCEHLNDLLEDGQALIINGNSETNILACLAAKRHGVRKTVAMVDNLDYVSMAESLDIGTIINKRVIAASHIYQMMFDVNVHNVHFITSANADVAEFIPESGSRVTKRLVRDLNLPNGITIGGIVRDGEGMLVSGNTQIQAGDSVMVFCHAQKLSSIEKYFKHSIW